METKFKVGDEFYAYSNRGCFLPYTVIKISINIKIGEENTLTEVRYEAVSNTVGVKEHRMIDEDEAFNKEDLKEMLERVIERIQDKAQLPE